MSLRPAGIPAVQVGWQLLTFEDAMAQATEQTEELEKSWLLENMKSSPAVQQRLLELTFEKLNLIAGTDAVNGNSPQAILAALDHLHAAR